MDNALWAFGRVSGIISLALFTGTVLLGILNRSEIGRASCRERVF